MMLEDRARRAAEGVRHGVELMPARAVAAAPGTYESFLRFEERRRRAERIEAVVVAVVLFAAALGLAIGLLRSSLQRQPADTIITPDEVGDLELEWSVSTGDPDAMYSTNVAGDLVIATTKEGELLAYPVECSEPCAPTWHANIGRPIWRTTISGGVIYVAERATGDTPAFLHAFSAECGSGGAECDPLWSGEIGAGTKWNVVPLVAGGRVVVASSDGVSAFEIGCGAEGARCDPVWHARPEGAAARTRSGIDAATATDDTVFVATPDLLAAYPVDCVGECAPLWSRPAPQNIGWMTVWGNDLVLGTMVRARAEGAEQNHVWALPADCGRQRGCDVAWSIETEGVTPVTAVDDTLYVLDDIGDLVAYERPCDASGCRERWRVRKPLTQPLAAESPLAIDGVVYVSSTNGYLFAYPEDCEANCQPIWQTTEAGWGYTYVAVGAGKVLAGSDGIYAFGVPATEEAEPSSSWPGSSLPIVPLLVAVGAVVWLLVRLRRRRRLA
jgi:outer membrane protein assembly factor BamB